MVDCNLKNNYGKNKCKKEVGEAHFGMKKFK